MPKFRSELQLVEGLCLATKKHITARPFLASSTGTEPEDNETLPQGAQEFSHSG